jgi:hypothetical protein
VNTIEQAKQVVELLKDGQAGDCSPIGNRYAAIDTINALIEELASIKGQEPVAIPDDVRTVAKAMQKDSYRGPLAWATKVIDFVVDYTHPPTAPAQQRDALHTAMCGLQELAVKAELERDTYQVEADKLAAENKVLRDALEQVTEVGGIAAVSIARAALKGANHEPN